MLQLLTWGILVAFASTIFVQLPLDRTGRGGAFGANPWLAVNAVSSGQWHQEPDQSAGRASGVWLVEEGRAGLPGRRRALFQRHAGFPASAQAQDAGRAVGWFRARAGAPAAADQMLGRAGPHQPGGGALSSRPGRLERDGTGQGAICGPALSAFPQARAKMASGLSRIRARSFGRQADRGMDS